MASILPSFLRVSTVRDCIIFYTRKNTTTYLALFRVAEPPCSACVVDTVRVFAREGSSDRMGGAKKERRAMP